MDRLGRLIVLLALVAVVGASHVAQGTPPSNEDTRRLAAACQLSGVELREQLGSECRAIVRPPFVIGGDLPADELASWHADTIRPAAQAMLTSYIRTRPTQPVRVLLFNTTESYRRFSQELFGTSKVSIYGYYRPNHRTLIANLSTGGGTLVHELTHALLDFDFPDAPAWFNEGLASLHEACRFRTSPHGVWLEGVVNWRLKGLQTVIRQGRLRPIASLVEDPAFRGPLEGANYAQARYLCLYLQQRGLLEEFYREFRGHRAIDPQGLAALERVLGEASWQSLDEDFRRWALELAE